MIATSVEFNALLEEIPGDIASGIECGSDLGFQQLTTMADYLGAKADQVGLDQTAAGEFTGENAESDRRAAEAFCADGRRRIFGLEEFVKEITGKTASLQSVQQELESRSTALLQHTGKDLRIVRLLQLAWVGSHGLEGLLSSIELANSLLDRYGPATHPMADEDAPEDFWAQATAVAEMLSGASSLAVFRQARLFSGAVPGKWVVGTIEAMALPADGEAPAVNPPLLELKAFATGLVASQDAVPVDKVSGAALTAFLDGRLQTVDSCIKAARKLSSRFGHGVVQGGDKIVGVLGRLKKILGFLSGGDAAPTSEVLMNTHEGRNESPNSRPATQATVGALQSRDDARKMILEVCKFLDRTEPSHPAPYFLKRAERLLGAKDFFEILRDMAPEALSEIERITGHRESVQ